VFLDSGAPAELRARLEAQQETVLAAVTPGAVEARGHVRGLLDGYSVALVADDRAAARQAVYQLLAEAVEDGVVAVDTETAVLPEFQAPVPVAINKDGTIAKRQPKAGAAGYALDPRRSRVRLLQAHAGGNSIVLFDTAAVSWDAVAPLFEHDLAMFNAVFDIKAIIANGGPEPAGRVFDTMTAMRLLAPCESWPVAMAAAADVLLELKVPKGLGTRIGPETWTGTGKTGALAASQHAFRTHGEGVRGLPELMAVKQRT
jgi:hypothetical protein